MACSSLRPRRRHRRLSCRPEVLIDDEVRARSDWRGPFGQEKSRESAMIPLRPPGVRRNRFMKFATAVFLLSAVFALEAQAADVFKTISGKPAVKAALDQIRREDERTLREQIEISEISAPSRKEDVRANDYIRRLRELGLTEISTDAEGNVIARRAGVNRNGPTLVLSAHLDTVFSAETNVKVRKEGNRYYGPGIA